jgi:hypothetical protein
VRSYDLDERRHAVLIDEEVVERSTPGPAFLAGHSLLARDQEPAARTHRIDGVPGNQARMSREELLKQILTF